MKSTFGGRIFKLFFGPSSFDCWLNVCSILQERLIMARTPQDITDAELAVLNVLWEHGSCTVRFLTDTVYPGGSGEIGRAHV